MKIDDESMARFAEVVKAEKARLVELANGEEDCYFLRDDYFIPSGPPKVILPPNIEPHISMAELCYSNPDLYARMLYERSGRYTSVYNDREEADRTDKYKFTRPFLPGGVLPWEK
jgi:hypothetical protein